jgi:hypothetical protein
VLSHSDKDDFKKLGFIGISEPSETDYTTSAVVGQGTYQDESGISRLFGEGDIALEPKEVVGRTK